MKKKYFLYLILPVMVSALLGVGIASACGWGGFFGFGNLDPETIAERQQAMFQNQAGLLGININEIKNYWAEGKTMAEIMEEKGISQEEVQARIKELQTQRMEAYLQILVDKGVITQEQADKRLETVQNRFENGITTKTRRGFKGFGLGKGFRGFAW